MWEETSCWRSNSFTAVGTKQSSLREKSQICIWQWLHVHLQTGKRPIRGDHHRTEDWEGTSSVLQPRDCPPPVVCCMPVKCTSWHFRPSAFLSWLCMSCRMGWRAFVLCSVENDHLLKVAVEQFPQFCCLSKCLNNEMGNEKACSRLSEKLAASVLLSAVWA